MSRRDAQVQCWCCGRKAWPLENGLPGGWALEESGPNCRRCRVLENMLRVVESDALPPDRALVVSRVKGPDGEDRLSAVVIKNIGSGE